MDMRGPPASPVKSLEETLHQCVEDLERRKLATSYSPGAATKPAEMFVKFENLKRSDEASPSPHQERGFNCKSPRGSNEKMGPRPGRVGKPHRQQRQTSKGALKVYPADTNNFRALVYEHTSMRASSPTRDVVSQPTSPLTPPSTSNPLAFAFTSQPSSPTTPHSTQSSSPSPLSSPHTTHTDSGPYISHLHFPLLVHTENKHHHNTHLNVPYPHPLLCDVNQNPTPNRNPNLHHNNYMPRCASTPCIGTSSDAGNVPSDNSQAQSLSPEQFARMLSLERYLLDDNDVRNPDHMVAIT